MKAQLVRVSKPIIQAFLFIKYLTSSMVTMKDLKIQKYIKTLKMRTFFDFYKSLWASSWADELVRDLPNFS